VSYKVGRPATAQGQAGGGLSTSSEKGELGQACLLGHTHEKPGLLKSLWQNAGGTWGQTGGGEKVYLSFVGGRLVGRSTSSLKCMTEVCKVFVASKNVR